MNTGTHVPWSGCSLELKSGPLTHLEYGYLHPLKGWHLWVHLLALGYKSAQPLLDCSSEVKLSPLAHYEHTSLDWAILMPIPLGPCKHRYPSLLIGWFSYSKVQPCCQRWTLMAKGTGLLDLCTCTYKYFMLSPILKLSVSSNTWLFLHKPLNMVELGHPQ